MQAGKLRNKVTIEQYVAGSPEQRASGEPDAAWSVYATTMAEIRPLVGREFFAAQQVSSKVDTKIRIRYRTGVTAGMRVNKSGTYYNIEAVINVENRNRELMLMCGTGVNDG